MGSYRAKTPFSFLYINPYDTGEVFLKMQKSALFGIRKTQNFLIGLFFRSKPRCKKIVTGGGVVQVGKKRAPQGLFLRNFTPPHEVRGLLRTNFCSSEEHFFEICEIFFLHAMMKFFSKFFSQKMTPKNVEKPLHRAY